MIHSFIIIIIIIIIITATTTPASETLLEYDIETLSEMSPLLPEIVCCILTFLTSPSVPLGNPPRRSNLLPVPLQDRCDGAETKPVQGQDRGEADRITPTYEGLCNTPLRPREGGGGLFPSSSLAQFEKISLHSSQKCDQDMHM
jgi:hypothetical protein